MLSPSQLFRLINELIFLLLGGLLAWIGASGRVFFDRRSLAWVIVSLTLILWGLRALAKPGRWEERWQNWMRGISLVLTGAILLAISRVPFSWVGPLLVTTGFLLMARGIFSTTLVFRNSSFRSN